jgi:hypothetical protein
MSERGTTGTHANRQRDLLTSAGAQWQATEGARLENFVFSIRQGEALIFGLRAGLASRGLARRLDSQVLVDSQRPYALHATAGRRFSVSFKPWRVTLPGN